MKKFFLTVLLIVTAVPALGGVGLYKHLDLSANPVTGCRLVVGDLTGDGLIDYLFNDGRRLIRAFDHNGALLWEKINTSDPGVEETYHNFTISVYDIDLDNQNEVICLLEINGQHTLAVVNGVTGNVETYAVLPFPAPRDHENFGLDNYYMQDHIAITNLRGLSKPQDILAIHANKLKIAAYSFINGALVQQWYYVTQHDGYSSGHWAFPYDIDSDGKDEVIAGSEILNESGALQWSVDIGPFNPDNPDWGLDHVDASSCADIDPSHPGKEIVFVAATGIWMYGADGTQMWHHPSQIIDPVNGYFSGEGIQEVLVGNFRTDVNGLEAVIYSEDMYGSNTVAIFDRFGNPLKWESQTNGPRRWVTCAMDWDGDRSVDEIYSRQGIFNGQFIKVSDAIKWSYMKSADVTEFPPVICDVTGDQREEIIWYDTNELFVMYNTSALVGSVKASPWTDIRYKLRIANNNHCSAMYFDWPAMDKQPDTTPPNAPVQLNSTHTTASSITLAWQAPTQASDGDLASSYDIYRNGTKIGSSEAASWQDSGLQGETNYSYSIYALDEADNASVTAASAVFQTLDGVPPNAPSSIQSSYQTDSDIALSWTASTTAPDGDPAVSYRIMRDGVLIATQGTTNYLDHNLASSSLFSYQVFALDHAGNVSASPASGSFRTYATPVPNVILKDLDAAIISSPPVKLSGGIRMITLQVSTTSLVSELPSSLILVESDGTTTPVPLSGTVPGTQFAGTLIIDSSVAHGEAYFELPEESLVDIDGNPGTSEIKSGQTIYIDQRAPIRPKSLKIISAVIR